MSDAEFPFASLLAKAEAGDIEAQYELGWRHALGSGLEEDETAALHWLGLAAANGHHLAQNNLGARYVAGEGVPVDLVEAYVWFHRAALQGDRKAEKNRDSLPERMTAGQWAEARQRTGE